MTADASAERADSRFYAVLVTYRRADLLPAAIEAVMGQERPPLRLVVVDNAPDAANEWCVSAWGASVEYLPAPANLGPAGGNALGLERILALADDGDWVATVDDDDPPPRRDTFARLLSFAEQEGAADPTIGGVGLRGARLNRRRGMLERITAPAGRSALADTVPGGWCPIFKVGAVRAAGSFRTELFYGFEELDFGLRLRTAGYTIHVVGGTGKVGSNSSGVREPRPSMRLPDANWRRYYSLRNLIDVLRYHGLYRAAVRVSFFALAKPLVNLPLTPRLAMRHLALNCRAMWDGWRGRLGMVIEPDGSPRVGLDRTRSRWGEAPM